MTEILIESEPLICFDPAKYGDISAILIIEKQMITATELFDNPVTFNKYRVLASFDLKGMDYLVQIRELCRIVNKVRGAFRKDPVVLVDAGGNEGLNDSLKEALPGVRLCKFSGDMSREITQTGGYRMINKPVWVQKLSLLLEQNRILIDDEMQAAKEIRKQLEQFSAVYRASGAVGYESKGAGHDDYISCLLLCIAERKGYSTFPMPNPVSYNTVSPIPEYRYAGY
jgi:hypothetical protein